VGLVEDSAWMDFYVRGIPAVQVIGV
jgi:hypothetical protein